MSEEQIGQGGYSTASDMFQTWFLEYASYVICDRAIPAGNDGLKPVQRRLLHTLREMDDGRLNKAANVIGATMRYHPHGDMAIEDALVKLAQKDVLLETQGNWGNSLTGDRAAAARYIEVRLSPLAKEILFSDSVTEWQDSYDGRNKEPVGLPVKFPLLLLLGAEGIAVGLSTKILPHNFRELLKESIAVLRGRRPCLYPDFHSGGFIDVSEYRDGAKGSRIRIRARIEEVDSKLLEITEIPFSTTTQGLIDSILAANDKGKIKIRKIEDNTAGKVSIQIHLVSGTNVEQTLEALYAFTDCEMTVAPSCCVIEDQKPVFCGVSELLKNSTHQTRRLLERELKIDKKKLLERILHLQLERWFIEQKIYRKIEIAETWDDVVKILKRSLKSFDCETYRQIKDQDLTALTDIKIRRITKYDSKQADEALLKIESALKDVEESLSDIVNYTIQWYQYLLKKYGGDLKRKTEITTFGKVKKSELATSYSKLYVDRKEGFVGTSLKNHELLCECSNLDEVIAFCQDGTVRVVKVDEKIFVGQNIIHIEIFQRGDERRVYHMIFRDGKDGPTVAKRFQVTSVIRGREYQLTRGSAQSKILHFSVNPDGEAEQVVLQLKPKTGLRKKSIECDFSNLPIRSRQTAGTIVTPHVVQKVDKIVRGGSTLGKVRIWFDQGQLHQEEQGKYLGRFQGGDKLLAVYQNGYYEVLPFALNMKFSEGLLNVCAFTSDQYIQVIWFDEQKSQAYARKSLLVDEEGRQTLFPRGRSNKLCFVSIKDSPSVVIEADRNREDPVLVDFSEVQEVKTPTALGSKVCAFEPYKVKIRKK
ncbi:MAG: DNA gyrase/topoisomerase IV subunit A [Oligoflexales bacterium]